MSEWVSVVDRSLVVVVLLWCSGCVAVAILAQERLKRALVAPPQPKEPTFKPRQEMLLSSSVLPPESSHKTLFRGRVCVVLR